VAENEDRTRPLPGLLDWERRLAAIIAHKFERVELQELKAELYKTIIELKAQPLSHVQNWEKYLAKALHNRADSWTKQRRDAVKSESVLTQHEPWLFFPSKEGDLDDQLAMAEFRRALEPKLREVWEALEKHNFNQVKAAQELGIHRNTLGSRLRRIKPLVIAHGFSLSIHFREGIVKTAPKSADFVSMPSSFLRKVVRIRLSGMAWRLLFWLMRELSRRKQATIPFSWHQIAQKLTLDRGNISRAGQNLVRAGLVFIQDDRIGLRRKLGRLEGKRNSRASRRSSSRSVVKKQRL
jgi:DNA-directed RNA polymerase specialized sigma24 family protein